MQLYFMLILQREFVTLSVGVGRMFSAVCLSVCQQHNSKTNDPKVFKLVGISWDIMELTRFLGLKVTC